MPQLKELPPEHVVPSLARTLSGAGYERSVSSLTEYLAANPRSANAFHNRAVAFYHLGRLPEALADFRRAIECDPQKRWAYFLLTEIHRAGGEREKEIAVCTAALENLTETYDRWKALGERADARYALGDAAGALRDLDAAVALVPTLKAARLARGNILYRTGEREKGLRDIKDATIGFDAHHLDWRKVSDIVRAEPELQSSGFLRQYREARRIVEAAGRPVDGDDLPEAEKLAAVRERRAIAIYVARSMGDKQAFYQTADEDSLRWPTDGWLVFPGPIPENLRGSRHTQFEDAFEVHLLFDRCASLW